MLQACQIAHDLELHDAFTIFDFIFPLLLQDKINIAEPYLEEAKSMQLPFIELLDSLLDRSASILSICDPYIAWVWPHYIWANLQFQTGLMYFSIGIIRKYGYRDLCIHKVQPKTLSKLIKRLAKQYNLDEPQNVTKGTFILMFTLHHSD